MAEDRENKNETSEEPKRNPRVFFDVEINKKPGQMRVQSAKSSLHTLILF